MAVASVASRVVHWQRVHGRNELPWQLDRDPYRVWLSEIMLQQTQVATVSAYFQRFIGRLPTVADLARAPLDEVLGLWSGLGYYTRARNLHRCAQIIVADHRGVFPRDCATLAGLPGIGRSTAAAIASLCFGQRAAILDGNVRRVLARLTAFEGDLATTRAQAELWAIAESLLPRRNLQVTMPRYTQGMMDLGATVCLAREPRCAECPLRATCAGHRGGEPTRYPLRSRKVRRSSQSVWLLWAHDDQGGVWLQRRPPRGIWGGLHCLPWFDSRDALLAAVPADQHARLVESDALRHVLTHRDLHLHAVRWQLAPGDAGPADASLFAPAQWRALGLPAPVRAWLDQVCSQPNEVAG